MRTSAATRCRGVEQILERLAAANIQLLPLLEITNHFVFERDGFVCLVERQDGGFGAMGAPGVLSPKGLAVLVWRGTDAFFVARGIEQAATQQQVESLRRFTRDLQTALNGPEGAGS